MTASVKPMNFLVPRIKAWWLLCLASMITITIVAASQLFTQRISILLDRQAAELLAADMLIDSNDPMPASYRELAQRYGLQTAYTIGLRTAIFIQDEPQLIELKAVSAGYPLRGTLERKAGLFEPAQKVTQGPLSGEVWIDSKIAALLNQPIELGMQSLAANWVISYEPDRGGSLFNLAPRIMMHIDDLPATGLLVPGSRARYNLLLAGDAAALSRFAEDVKPRLSEGEKLQTLDNARPEMRNALERTRLFFALSIVLTLVIAMIAIAITAKYSASQEAVKVAVMRTFGISSRRLIRYYLLELLKVWLWALPLGLLAGYLAQFPLQWALGLWFGARLPETGLMPYLLAALIGFISLTGFSLPHLLNVLDTPPMQVLRQIRQSSTPRNVMLLVLSSLLTLFLVLLLIVNQFQLALMLFALVIVLAGFIPLVLKLILQLFSRFGRNRFWLNNYLLSRLLSGQRNALFVMSGFSLTLLSVLLISQVKDQLLEDWETQLPQDKPNYFLVNIPTAEAQPLSRFLQDNGVSTSQAYALVRTRLSAINQQDVKTLTLKTERGRHLLNHVFNLSFADQLPPDNQLLQGEWLDQHSVRSGFSVEQGMAEELGLKLGDELQFTLQGETFAAPVSSIRSVVWENFQPNFFILASRQLLEGRPQTWLMSAFIDDSHKALLKPLLQQHPSVTLLDISELMQRIKGIIQRASVALEFFFGFATLSAIIVLISALNTTNPMRETEIALLQALGANRRQKLQSQLAEFALMGVLVGVFAALFANLIGWFVGYRFFDLVYSFSVQLWVYSVFTSVVLITAFGTLFVYRSFSISPMRLLRS